MREGARSRDVGFVTTLSILSPIQYVLRAHRVNHSWCLAQGLGQRLRATNGAEPRIGPWEDRESKPCRLGSQRSVDSAPACARSWVAWTVFVVRA